MPGVGADMLAQTKLGSPAINSVATAGSSQAKNAWALLPITMVQPADPSARLISSKISTVVAGSSSRPAQGPRQVEPEQPARARAPH